MDDDVPIFLCPMASQRELLSNSCLGGPVVLAYQLNGRCERFTIKADAARWQTMQCTSTTVIEEGNNGGSTRITLL